MMNIRLDGIVLLSSLHMFAILEVDSSDLETVQLKERSVLI